MGSEAGRGIAEPGRLARVTEAARDLVDYMLFVDEAPLTGPVKGGVRVRGVVRRQRPARRAGPFAARVRSAPAAVQVSVQLHDLHAGIRCPSAGSQERGLLAPVGSAVRRETHPSLRVPDSAGPAGNCLDSARRPNAICREYFETGGVMLQGPVTESPEHRVSPPALK